MVLSDFYSYKNFVGPIIQIIKWQNDIYVIGYEIGLCEYILYEMFLLFAA